MKSRVKSRVKMVDDTRKKINRKRKKSVKKEKKTRCQCRMKDQSGNIIPCKNKGYHQEYTYLKKICNHLFDKPISFVCCRVCKCHMKMYLKYVLYIITKNCILSQFEGDAYYSFLTQDEINNELKRIDWNKTFRNIS